MIKTVVINTMEGVMQLLADQERNAENGRLRSAYFFRGLPNVDFQLKTSLQRNCKHMRKELEPIILNNFAKYASIEDPLLSNSIWKQMVVGQHHGLPTRLLDWTHSPLIALHFANDEPLDNLDKHDCVVWRIDARDLNKNLPERYRAELAKRRTFIFSMDALNSVVDNLAQYDLDMNKNGFVTLEPPSVDQRIINQYSFFSVIPSEVESIEELIDRSSDKAVRYIIKKELRWDIRDLLDQMNINERIIYPGLLLVISSVPALNGITAGARILNSLLRRALQRMTAL